jgi:hypothetical protein
VLFFFSANAAGKLNDVLGLSAVSAPLFAAANRKAAASGERT